VIFRDTRVVLNFGDLMILGMAFPNITGVLLLTGVVKADLDDYLDRLRTGRILPSPSARSAEAPLG